MATLEMETRLQVIWEAAVGEELECRRERHRVDRYAVAVNKDKTVVSHVPRKISRMYSLLYSLL